ncbi:hypothetical protein [Ktedonospora formicarum]|uniref:Uncharacterized protein n=1 Tax=Ktedonospora formicarum TaxID=2778364 RepID=A0A8J3I8I2_9CHLR|nr:hypothetical protein [Ktedonospora formicarum]GHO51449.1 hypothetical protein KSX_96120 [Ktedonospora formicarum]
MAKQSYKSGQIAPASAQMVLVGPRGGKTSHEITAVKGKRLPPTPQKGQSYQIADRTKNDAGKGK